MKIKVLLYDKENKKKFVKIFNILNCLGWEDGVYSKLGIDADKRFKILKHKFKTAYTIDEIKKYVKFVLDDLKKMKNKKLYKDLKHAYIRSNQSDSLLPLKKFIQESNHIVLYKLKFINDCDIKLKHNKEV